MPYVLNLRTKQWSEVDDAEAAREVVRAARRDGSTDIFATLADEAALDAALKGEASDALRPFYVTFGFGYNLRYNYQVIRATSAAEARSIAAEHLPRDGDCVLYAFMYDEEEFAGQPEQYGLTEVPLGTEPVRL